MTLAPTKLRNSLIIVYQWFISKKNIIFQGFSEGPTFCRGEGSNIFQGGGGVQMLICIDTQITFDFPGGGPDPLFPQLDLHMYTCILHISQQFFSHGGRISCLPWLVQYTVEDKVSCS